MRTKILLTAMLSVMAFVLGPLAAHAAQNSSLETQSNVTLIQPLFGNASSATVATSGTTIAFLVYFGNSAQWLATVAFGFCFIWLAVGGIMIMIGMKDEGKSHITWALIGISVLAFSGAILQALNSAFFV